MSIVAATWTVEPDGRTVERFEDSTGQKYKQFYFSHGLTDTERDAHLAAMRAQLEAALAEAEALSVVQS
jgi:hypothetical protein